jgi:hypothetical protein
MEPETTSIRINNGGFRINPDLVREYRTIAMPTISRGGSIEYQPYVARIDEPYTYEIWACGNGRCPCKEKCRKYQEGFYHSNDENTCEYFDKVVD